MGSFEHLCLEFLAELFRNTFPKSSSASPPLPSSCNQRAPTGCALRPRFQYIRSKSAFSVVLLLTCSASSIPSAEICTTNSLYEREKKFAPKKNKKGYVPQILYEYSLHEYSLLTYCMELLHSSALPLATRHLQPMTPAMLWLHRDPVSEAECLVQGTTSHCGGGGPYGKGTVNSPIPYYFRSETLGQQDFPKLSRAAGRRL